MAIIAFQEWPWRINFRFLQWLIAIFLLLKTIRRFRDEAEFYLVLTIWNSNFVTIHENKSPDLTEDGLDGPKLFERERAESARKSSDSRDWMTVSFKSKGGRLLNILLSSFPPFRFFFFFFSLKYRLHCIMSIFR